MVGCSERKRKHQESSEMRLQLFFLNFFLCPDLKSISKNVTMCVWLVKFVALCSVWMGGIKVVDSMHGFNEILKFEELERECRNLLSIRINELLILLSVKAVGSHGEYLFLDDCFPITLSFEMPKKS